MKKETKFRLLFLLGVLICIPFILFSIVAQYFLGAILFTSCFVVYCCLLYRFVYKRMKPRYPMVPPEGRGDIYFPRTNIPRPIYEDMQRYPEFFKRKKSKYKRTGRERKKSGA